MSRAAPKAVALALLCALVAPAVAAGRASSMQATIPPFTVGGATAVCARGGALVAGGFTTATTESTGLIVSSLLPSAGGWSANATNAFVNDGSVTAIAYCGRQVKLTRVSRSVTVPPQRGGAYPTATVSATCPHGTTVRVGGFEATTSPQPDGPSLVVNGLERPSPRRWTVSASNGGPQAGTLHAIAECGRAPAPVEVERAVTLPRSGGVHSVTAACPRRKTVAFGGFRTSPYNGDGPYASQLQLVAPSRWRAAAFEFPGHTSQLVALAYCA